jgi:DHA2 family multidrug resistance protein
VSASTSAAAAYASEPPIQLDFPTWMMIIGVMLAVVLEILDTSIVNVALPSMMGNLGATVDEISWVATSYIVANVCVIPMTGWLAGRFGRRRYFVGSIALFTLASFLCGAARTLPELVVFRVIQGIGGGALLAVGQSVLIEVFPPQQQGTGQAIFGLGAMLGPSLGPTLGGWITDVYDWPWIFYVNVPLGIAAALLCSRYLPHPPAGTERRTRGVDWPGIALLVVGIASLQILLESGHKMDWFDSDQIVALACTSAASIGLFVWHELRTAHPVVDLRVLRHRALVVGCTYGIALGIGLYGSVFLFPIFTQDVLGWTSWQSGMGILPSSIATALTMPLAGRLVWRLGPAPLFAFGVAIFLPSLWGMSHWTLQSGWWDLFWPQVGRGVAMGAMFSPLSVATLRALPPRDVLQGSGLYNLFRQTGGSLGIAVLATLIDHRGTVHHAYLSEHVTAFSEATRLRLAELAAGLQMRGIGAAEAMDAARQMLDRILHAQAAALAFRDCYLLIFVVFLLLVPLIPLLRRPEAARAAAMRAGP